MSIDSVALPATQASRWGGSPVLTAARLLITATAAVGALVASFIFLRTLAAETGWPGRSALLLPLSVDALAAAAWLGYWSASDPAARRFAGRVGAGATVASLLGNGLSHLLVTGAVEPTAALIAIIGGVPAVSLALVVRLMVPSLALNPTDLAPEPKVSRQPSPGGDTKVVEKDAPDDRPVRSGRPSVDILLAALPDGTPNSATAIRAALAGRGHRIGPTRAAQLRDLRVNGSPREEHHESR